MIVNSGGTALTQKREPKMCRIKPTINLTSHRLIIHSGIVSKSHYCHQHSSVLMSATADASKDVANVNVEANYDVYPAKHCQTKVCQDK